MLGPGERGPRPRLSFLPAACPPSCPGPDAVLWGKVHALVLRGLRSEGRRAVLTAGSGVGGRTTCCSYQGLLGPHAAATGFAPRTAAPVHMSRQPWIP